MTPAQCRMARAGLGLAVRDLAALAGVPAAVITRLERGEALQAGMADSIRQALEAAGAEFIGGDAPGVRLRRRPDGSAPHGRPRREPRRHVGPEDEERGQQAGDLPFNQRDD